MVVDDEENLREIHCHYLEKAGFATIEAKNATEAGELLLENKVDLIISDIRMQNGDGLELLKTVRDKFKGKPPVVIATGFNDGRIRIAKELGAIAVLIKPVSEEGLLKSVNHGLTITDS